MRSQTPQPHGLIIMQPRTGLVSAMSPSRTAAWYHSGKFCSRVMDSARLLIGSPPVGPKPKWLALAQWAESSGKGAWRADLWTAGAVARAASFGALRGPSSGAGSVKHG